MNGRVGVWLHVSLTSGIGGERSDLRLSRSTPGERATSNHWMGGYVGPKAGLDTLENKKFLALARNRTPISRPFSCQSVALPTELHGLLQISDSSHICMRPL
jgi:hypothetical protein